MSHQHQGEAKLERKVQEWTQSQQQVAEVQQQAEEIRQERAEQQGGAE
ncbi:hypothetical protein [Kitasatospora griseola]|nr:hypothetical protein [Kitasatospora griseola]GGR04258.1 hypothetical protein GCM10010195_69680 [Kitasatospora griseola]